MARPDRPCPNRSRVSFIPGLPHLRGFPRRTLGPPPFSSINSTPAVSSAWRTAKHYWLPSAQFLQLALSPTHNPTHTRRDRGIEAEAYPPVEKQALALHATQGQTVRATFRRKSIFQGSREPSWPLRSMFIEPRWRYRIAHLHATAIQKTVQELRETETELDDVAEQIHAAQDVVERIEIRAPVRGVVVKRHFHTAGGVVAPGAVILELLPMHEDLLIEARVNPNDISYVRVEQQALARLSALNQRITPMIEAKVVYVSADALPEQAPLTKGGQDTRRDLYVARVRLDEADMRKRMDDFGPTPGMPADVYIKTGERNLLRVHHEARARQLRPRVSGALGLRW